MMFQSKEVMPNEAVKGIGVFVSVVVAAGFTFSAIAENSATEFSQVITGFGDPMVLGLGLVLVPVSLYFLFKGPLG